MKYYDVLNSKYQKMLELQKRGLVSEKEIEEIEILLFEEQYNEE